MMELVLRFCTDCAHSIPSRGHFPVYCSRPLPGGRVDLVTGREARIYASASSERRNTKTILGRERCGPMAKFFTACQPPSGGPAPRPFRG